MLWPVTLPRPSTPAPTPNNIEQHRTTSNSRLSMTSITLMQWMRRPISTCIAPSISTKTHTLTHTHTHTDITKLVHNDHRHDVIKKNTKTWIQYKFKGRQPLIDDGDPPSRWPFHALVLFNRSCHSISTRLMFVMSWFVKDAV